MSTYLHRFAQSMQSSTDHSSLNINVFCLENKEHVPNSSAFVKELEYDELL